MAVSKFLAENGLQKLSMEMLNEGASGKDKSESNRGPEFPPPVPSIFKEVHQQMLLAKSKQGIDQF